MEKTPWVQVGAIWKRQGKDSLYLKVKAEVTLTEGQILHVQDPRKRPGITAERLAKIPADLKAEIFIAPPKGE